MVAWKGALVAHSAPARLQTHCGIEAVEVRSGHGDHRDARIVNAIEVGALLLKTSTASRGRIVLVTYGSLGDIQPFLAIGAALRERGHDAVIATSEAYRRQIRDTGLEFAPVRPDRQPCQRDPDFLDRLRLGRDSPSDVFRQMFLPSLRESVADLLPVAAGADVFVTHPLATGARLVAEREGLPWVSAVMQPMGYLSFHEPPVIGPPWIAAALRRFGAGPTRRFHGAVRAVTGAWMREWHAVRAELRLPHSDQHPLWEGQHSSQRSIGLFPRVLGAAQPDWPAAARITGFPFYEAPGAALDPDLVRFLDAGPAPVVFTLGTTAVNDPGPFYEESAEAAFRLGLRAVLVVRPGSIDCLQRWSDDVVAVPHAPHHRLFARALAVVHQGGIGTLSEAMRAEKPMLIMPYGHDQADNAWRASRLGIARIVARRRYRAGAVRRGLQGLLDDERCATAVARTARGMAREQGAAAAAEWIERVLP